MLREKAIFISNHSMVYLSNTLLVSKITSEKCSKLPSLFNFGFQCISEYFVNKLGRVHFLRALDEDQVLGASIHRRKTTPALLLLLLQVRKLSLQALRDVDHFILIGIFIDFLVLTFTCRCSVWTIQLVCILAE